LHARLTAPTPDDALKIRRRYWTWSLAGWGRGSSWSSTAPGSRMSSQSRCPHRFIRDRRTRYRRHRDQAAASAWAFSQQVVDRSHLRLAVAYWWRVPPESLCSN